MFRIKNWQEVVLINLLGKDNMYGHEVLLYDGIAGEWKDNFFGCVYIYVIGTNGESLPSYETAGCSGRSDGGV